MSKILEVLQNKINSTEKQNNCIITKAKLFELSGLSKEDFTKEYEKLLTENKIFYDAKKEKDFGFDGKFKQEEKEVSRRYFIDQQKYVEYRTKEEKINEKLELVEKNKVDKVKTLSENAQKIFEAANKLMGTEYAFVKMSQVLKESGVSFEDSKNALKELSENKIAYGTFVTKDVEKEGKKEVEKKYVITTKNDCLSKISEKEKYKQSLREKDNSVSKETKSSEIKPKISKRKKEKEGNER
ncbi:MULTISPECIES: hypothetical protein [unclassified Fusobacterium]|uniref:hypothetical protein n=1 Tax=unclassified Fusobacterium TaxID=2648384 RepID=UPI001B8C4FFC|nr:MULTISPECIES: hypothetical protein [unclassified Fusobacterium]MBR8701046.1 hypothetical protein [Fusobacterium sp. DD45]MBR8710818.1 hypothetical protein [Fusobacterium sp. DD28]MBR8751404.1 hypothetical protein [Fusobacterium sp. DD26]